MYTNQEIFDKIWNYFIVEKHRPGIDETGQCLYRVSTECDSERCAMGVLIPDELYLEEFESQAASDLIGIYSGLIELFSQVDQDLLDELQGAHDNNADREDLPFHSGLELDLLMISSKYKLTIPGV